MVELRPHFRPPDLLDLLVWPSALAVPASRPASAPSGLNPSRQYAVSVDGEDAFVYLVATDGADVHNSSLLHVQLHPGGSHQVVVTLLEPESGPPKAAALRPDPVGAEGSLPTVTMLGKNTWSFQVSAPLRGVLEFGAEAYQLSSFSSGLMIFAEFVDTNRPDPQDPSVTYCERSTGPSRTPPGFPNFVMRFPDRF